MKNEIVKWVFFILIGIGFLFWLSGGDLQYLIILILFVLIFVAYESGISRGKTARDEEIEEEKSQRIAKKRLEKVRKKTKKNP